MRDTGIVAERELLRLSNISVLKYVLQHPLCVRAVFMFDGVFIRLDLVGTEDRACLYERLSCLFDNFFTVNHLIYLCLLLLVIY